MNIESYKTVRDGGLGIFEQERGLIAVHGKEAVQFLDGLITNDMKTLEDGAQMLAAFPNAKGRLLAVVRVLREGERFLFETESATHKTLFDNLFRFTFAGDFFVEDLSEKYRYFEIFGAGGPVAGVQAEKIKVFASPTSFGHFVENEIADAFKIDLAEAGAAELDADTFEVIRIENGVAKYGIDMDDNTIVPELGIDELISYTKGCYIGQEIIARIHFRGHVAKQLTGLVFDEGVENIAAGAELTTAEDKPAGRITSVVNSPNLGRTIALGYVRYDFLTEGTNLKCSDAGVIVTKLPFI